MIQDSIRIVFMGTSAYAEPVLRALHASNYNVVLVVTQPDRKKGRNRKKAGPPVKELATTLNLNVYQPEIIRRKECFQHLADAKPDLIITDPPRSGMHENSVKAILAAKPETIVYISCNSATQARDMALMKEEYNLIKCQPVDMFPHTSHIESVALLKLKE